MLKRTLAAVAVAALGVTTVRCKETITGPTPRTPTAVPRTFPRTATLTPAPPTVPPTVTSTPKPPTSTTIPPTASPAPPTATPVPAPGINLTGHWTGTYQGDPLEGCGAGPAEATFEQQGSTVTGLLSTTANSCGSRQRTFQGMVQGDMLIGTITEGGFSFGANGVLSGGTLNITFNNSYGYIFGHLTLHR